MQQSTQTVGDRSPEAASQLPPAVEPHDPAAVGSGVSVMLGAPDGSAHRWSNRSLVVLLGTSVVLLTAMLWHVGMVFLVLAPTNSVTQRHQKQIDDYIYPELGQNWQMFAPNPLQQNTAIGARVETAATDGTRRTWDWVNLSASHIEAMRHNPLPSHLDQNMLRRAWDFYVSNHNTKNGRPIGMRGTLSAEYLKRIALQRFGREWRGERITAVQVASRVNAVKPPRWSTQTVPDNTSYQVLPWWPVKDADYRKL